MKPSVRPITVDEAFDSPVFVALCDEYREESARDPGLMGALPSREAYTNMVNAGLMRPLGVVAVGGLQDLLHALHETLGLSLLTPGEQGPIVAGDRQTHSQIGFAAPGRTPKAHDVGGRLVGHELRAGQWAPRHGIFG